MAIPIGPTRLAVKRRLGPSRHRGFLRGRPSIQVTLLVIGLVASLAVFIAASAQIASEQSSGVATQITVTATDEVRLTTTNIETITALSNVIDVRVDGVIGVYSADGGTWIAVAVPINPGNLPPDVETAKANHLGPTEVIVPTRLDGTDLTRYVGEDMPLAYSRLTTGGYGEVTETTVQVVAAYSPEWKGYGPGTILASSEFVTKLLAARTGLSPEQFLHTVGLPSVTVNVDSVDAVDRVAADIRDLGFQVKPVKNMLGQLLAALAHSPYLVIAVGATATGLLVLLITQLVRTDIRRRASLHQPPDVD